MTAELVGVCYKKTYQLKLLLNHACICYVLCLALLYALLLVFLTDCSFFLFVTVTFLSFVCLHVNQVVHVNLILHTRLTALCPGLPR